MRETAQSPSLVPRKDPSLDRNPGPDQDPGLSLGPSLDPALHHETRDPSRGSLRERRGLAPEVLVETMARGQRLTRTRLWPTVTVQGLNQALPQLRPPPRKMMKTN